MERRDPAVPLTFDEALRMAREQARLPETVRPYRHEGLENARFGRGFAFLETVPADWGDVPGYVLMGPHGFMASGILGEHDTIEKTIDEHLSRHAHANRDIADELLGESQRLALEAFADGLDRVPGSQATPETTDHADFVLVYLRQFARSGTDGRRVLAGNDHLLERPTPGRRYTHPCPLCERPALHNPRYPSSVCGHCHDRTTDFGGRPIRGGNTSLSGGMAAYYTDGQNEQCVEVTRTGLCLIDGHTVRMMEGHFGGIVVEAGPPDRLSRATPAAPPVPPPGIGYPPPAS